MATMNDLDALALALPGAEKTVSDDGRPSYAVEGRVFAVHRRPRADALDPATGERLLDVLVFHVADLEEKELMLADGRGTFFTTPHFDGYASVLVRIPRLAELSRDELRDVVVGSWTTRAPKRVVRAWLAEHEPED